MRLREFTDMRSLEGSRGAWEALAARTPSAVPYVTPAFMFPWLRALPSPHQLRFLTAWEDDRMVGLAPLVERRQGRLGVRLTLRSFPLRGTSPPFEFLFAERAGPAVAAFLQFWRETGGWDLIELPGVPSASETAREVRAAAVRERLTVRSTDAARTVSVRVAGSWADYLASRSRMHRQNCTRALRRCESVGPTRLMRYPGDIDFDRALDMASHVIDRSWKRFAHDRARHARFFAELQGELRTAGMLSLRFVVVGGTPIAYLLEIRHGDTFHAFHIAYDLAFQHEGPGVLLLQDGIRAAHELGLAGYDLGGSAEYLRRWAEPNRDLETLVLTKGSLVSAIKVGLYERIRAGRMVAARRRADRTKDSRKSAARGG